MYSKENNPTVVMMIGGPASGKSFIRKREYPNLPVLDCDEFKKDHPEFDPQNITQEVHDYSKVILKREFFRYLSEGKSFVYDGTGTNLERYIKWIDQAHEAGYDVEMCFVRCDLQTALKRNRQRERFVSERVVKEKHSVVEISYDVLKGFADKSRVIDNS